MTHAPLTVAVRIPVWVRADGWVDIDFGQDQNGNKCDRRALTRTPNWRRVWVLADLPLPRVVEVAGRIET